MNEIDRTSDSGEELSFEDAEAINRLGSEYRKHMRNQVGRVARRKPIEEITQEFRGVLSWLMVEDIESADDRSVRSSNELYLDYSAYDIEDTFFIIYEHLKGRRAVRVEDIIREHEETNLKGWQEQQTRKAATFLIIHGADENEINEWKGVEGTARQQRAMRRMYWLLQEPYMQQFKEFLKGRATTEHPYSFAALALTVKGIIIDGQNNLSIQQQNRENMIPRKQEELDETEAWLHRALNICEHVFEKDMEDRVYQIKE